jgi:hypothetical protein
MTVYKTAGLAVTLLDRPRSNRLHEEDLQGAIQER